MQMQDFRPKTKSAAENTEKKRMHIEIRPQTAEVPSKHNFRRIINPRLLRALRPIPMRGEAPMQFCISGRC